MLFYIVLSIIVAVAGYFYIQLNSKSTSKSSSSSPVANGKSASSNNTAAAATDNKPVLVLFGSQTGTAEIFAKTLAREGAKLGVPTKFCDVENYETYNLEYERLVILVCATYGEGEPTDSMKDFHDWMLDDTRCPGEELASVKYTVFGHGDKQYKYFCEEGIVMDRRMDELGAQRIYGMGCGDAGSGQLEEQFDEWRRDLWPAVGRALNITIKANTEEPVEPECRMKFWEEGDTQAAALPFPKTASVLEPTQRLPVWVPVVKNEELLQNAPDRSTLGIDFDITDTIISYQAGDHLGILPCNQDSLVNDYLKILGVSDEEAERVFSLQDIKTLKNVFPARVTVRAALKWYIDLAAPPKKSTLRAFAHCCTDATEKENLLRILRVNAEAQQEFTKLCGKLRNMHGFLRKFSSAKVPLAFFLEQMPRMSPRYYSISSDLLATPTVVSVTVAVVKDGLCTTMLSQLLAGDKVPVFVRKSSFHLPLRAKDRPVIMIGPGTGVAPFIGFIHRRTAWKNKNAKLGEAILFFGCRKSNEDHIYQELCASALQDGVLSTLDVAYSREQSEKVYVQHRLQTRTKDIWRLISEEGANLYICGDAKHMAKDVEEVLHKMVMTEGSLSSEKAKEYLTRLETEERFLKDVWSSTL